MTQEWRNEDGTTARVPGNPLKRKWAKKYPPMREDCEGYACRYCGVCPRGAKWRVPKEDRIVWEQHRREVEAYIAKHNGIHADKASDTGRCKGIMYSKDVSGGSSSVGKACRHDKAEAWKSNGKSYKRNKH